MSDCTTTARSGGSLSDPSHLLPSLRVLHYVQRQRAQHSCDVLSYIKNTL